MFIPYEYKANFSPVYQKAIKGYYLNFETFSNLDSPEKTYYIPTKKEWGIEPSENEIWADFIVVEEQIKTSIKEKKALLCWEKHKDSYDLIITLRFDMVFKKKIDINKVNSEEEAVIMNYL